MQILIFLSLSLWLIVVVVIIVLVVFIVLVIVIVLVVVLAVVLVFVGHCLTDRAHIQVGHLYHHLAQAFNLNTWHELITSWAVTMIVAMIVLIIVV